MALTQFHLEFLETNNLWRLNTGKAFQWWVPQGSNL